MTYLTLLVQVLSRARLGCLGSRPRPLGLPRSLGHSPSPVQEGQVGSGSGSFPLQWRGIVLDDLQRVYIEFCRDEEAVPSLQSLQSQGRAAFPNAFACEYIFACTGD